MKGNFKHSMNLFDIKNCKRVFDSMNALAVVVTREFTLLWSNKEKAKNHVSEKCHAFLFGKDTPCDACPLSSPSETQAATALIDHQNAFYLVVIHPLSDNSGFLALHHDVTSTIKNNQSLEKIIEGLPMGIVLANSELQVEFVSQAFYKLFPFITSPFLGKDFRLVISRNSPPLPKSLLDFLFRFLKDPEDQTSTLRFEVASPAKRYFDVTCRSYNNSSHDSKKNNNKKLLFIFTDRTQEVMRQTIHMQAEAQSRLDALFQQLLQRLTPGLNEIEQLASSLFSRPKDQSKTTTGKKIRAIRGKAQQLINLLEELDDYKKKDGDSFGEVNVNSLLQKTIKNLDPQIRDRKIKVKLHLTRHMKLFQTDRKKLAKALVAVLENAIDGVTKRLSSSSEGFTPLIEVKTRMHGDIIEIQIRDNGEGVDKEKTGSSLDDKLFMSRAVIQSMGGTFELNSVKKVGTKVSIQIPTISAVPQKDQTETKRPTPKRVRKQTTQPIFHGARIWILGRRDFATEMIQSFLGKNGTQYKHIEHPDSLRKSLNTESAPDCLILNISDERTAQSFILQLKELNLLSKTTFAVPQELVPFLKRKFKGITNVNYISKPFLVDALVEALTSCLSGGATSP